jgi:hypothetical protein
MKKELSRHPRGFTLYEIGRTGDWHNLMLVGRLVPGGLFRLRKSGHTKNTWRFGWSLREQRLSSNSDTAHLSAAYPEIHAWVLKSAPPLGILRIPQKEGAEFSSGTNGL